VQVRLPEETIEALDEAVEELRAEHPGMSGISRSDVIRSAVVQAMAQRKKNARPRPRPGRPS
jgi:Arc/MetJ-type ribon-helix-helix transcriptional regulator